jgi:hypothetical protein
MSYALRLILLLFSCVEAQFLFAVKNEYIEAWWKEGHPFKLLSKKKFQPEKGLAHPQGMWVDQNLLYLSLVDEAQKIAKKECHQSYLNVYQILDSDTYLKKISQNDIFPMKNGECHLGGLEASADQQFIYAPLSQYRSQRAHTFILKWSKKDIKQLKSISVDDHISALVVGSSNIFGLNWDARKLYSIKQCDHGDCEINLIKENKERSLAYQDCKSLETPNLKTQSVMALCAGLSASPLRWNFLGFLRFDKWWDKKQMWEWPIETERSGALDWLQFDETMGTTLSQRLELSKIDGVVLSRNPFSVAQEEGNASFRLLFYFAPQDFPNTTLYTFESGWIKKPSNKHKSFYRLPARVTKKKSLLR